MPLVEPGMYFSSIEFYQDFLEIAGHDFLKNPTGVIKYEFLNIVFKLNFRTKKITRCDTKETKSFTYHNGTVLFEAFNLNKNVSISLRGGNVNKEMVQSIIK